MAGRTLGSQLKAAVTEGKVWVDFPFAYNSLSRDLFWLVLLSLTCFSRKWKALKNFPLCSVPELLLISENLAEHISALDAGVPRHCLLPELPLPYCEPGTRTFSSPVALFWKVSVLRTLARMLSLYRFCLGSCNSHLSVSENEIEGGYVCFGEEAIELLIWAFNYSQLAFFFPLLLL